MVCKLLSCSPKILSGLLRRFTQHFIFFSTNKFEGCTFNITVYRGDRCAMESQTGVQRFNKILHFVSSPRAGKLPPIRRWQTDKKTKLRCIQLKEIVIKINRIFLYTLNNSTPTPGVEGHRRRLVGE